MSSRCLLEWLVLSTVKPKKKNKKKKKTPFFLRHQKYRFVSRRRPGVNPIERIPFESPVSLDLAVVCLRLPGGRLEEVVGAHFWQGRRARWVGPGAGLWGRSYHRANVAIVHLQRRLSQRNCACWWCRLRGWMCFFTIPPRRCFDSLQANQRPVKAVIGWAHCYEPLHPRRIT